MSNQIFMKEVKIIQLGEKLVKLVFNGLEEETDLDQILRIDYSRLPAELITFPVVYNKIALLLADAENNVRATELDLEIFVAKQREIIRDFIQTENANLPKKPTADDIKVEQEAQLKGSPTFIVKSKKVNAAKRDCDYIKAVYWSAKAKIDLLTKLSEKVSREDLHNDLDNIAGFLNGVSISIREPLIK